MTSFCLGSSYLLWSPKSGVQSMQVSTKMLLATVLYRIFYPGNSSANWRGERDCLVFIQSIHSGMYLSIVSRQYTVDEDGGKQESERWQAC